VQTFLAIIEQKNTSDVGKNEQGSKAEPLSVCFFLHRELRREIRGILKMPLTLANIK
jgi:hypothetical protein